MNDAVKRLIDYVACVAGVACIVLYICLSPVGVSDYLDIIWYASTFTVFFSIFYVKFLWRYNPLEKRPRFAKQYSGSIEYQHDGTTCERLINFIVKQDLLEINIIVETESNRSASTTADIKHENGRFVLYYVYITNPDMKVLAGNPIQYGACRLTLEDTKCFFSNVSGLRGLYWNSEMRGGDLECSQCMQLHAFTKASVTD